MKTSKDPRHQSRRLAFAVIHAYKNSKDSNFPEKKEELLASSKELLEIETYDHKLFDAITNGVLKEEENLNELITTNSKEWAINKMYSPDIVCLLIATWEIKYTQTPVKVIIDESVELAKEFGEAESSKFINGVLAGIAAKKETNDA